MGDYVDYMAGKMSQENTDVVPAKRGRPSKSGPVLIDGLVVLTAEERERLNELAFGIKSDGEKIHRLMMKAAQRHFEIGKIIYATICKLRGLPTMGKLEQATGLGHHMCSTALKIYKHFKDAPELLEGLTMRDVAALISPPKEKREKTNKPDYKLPSGQLEFCEDSFGLPTMSGINMNNYRIVDGDQGRLYVLKRGVNIPVPVSQMTINPPDKDDVVMSEAYRELMNSTHCALEKYFSIMEAQEV